MIIGLLCFAAGQLSAQTFTLEEAMVKSRDISGAAKKAGQDAAIFKERTAALGFGEYGSEVFNPVAALDEAKMGVSAKFVSITPGEFEMGSPHDEDYRSNDEKRHIVKLTKKYELQATAVTQLQYFLVMGRNPSSFNKKRDCDSGNSMTIYGMDICANHPVEGVTWDDAQKFVEVLNKAQKKYVYRLPTEAEWEFAARAGIPSSFPYSFGFNQENELENHAWYSANTRGTRAVASKKANPFGLYDMYGNVWQWTQDWYGDYAEGVVTDPSGPSNGSSRVVRGGCWRILGRYSRSANREYYNPGARDSRVGFRLVRSIR